MAKNQSKSINVAFTNNEREILEEIQLFILKELQIKGHIIFKKKMKENHQNSYELRYGYKGALVVANQLLSRHPKKKHRIAICNPIKEKIKGNGKYSEQEKRDRDLLEIEFFKDFNQPQLTIRCQVDKLAERPRFDSERLHES